MIRIRTSHKSVTKPISKMNLVECIARLQHGNDENVQVKIYDIVAHFLNFTLQLKMLSH